MEWTWTETIIAHNTSRKNTSGISTIIKEIGVTAEVGVMNAVGVALAADSAVTVGRRAEKIYTSAEKLFRLSETAPVGVMFFGNAFFTGLPWETILKSYRRHIGKSRFDTIKEYGEDFISWLGDNRELFPEEVRERQIISVIISYFLYIRNEIEETLNNEAEVRDGLDDGDLPPILDKVVKENLKDVRSTPVLESLPENALSLLRKDLRSTLTNIKKEIFGNLPFKPSTKRLLSTLAIELLTHHYFGSFQCGLVVAGYCEKQYLPALVSYELEEMVLSKPRSTIIHDDVVSEPGDSYVFPFAQKDMVNTFMEGIDEKMNNFMMETTSELFSGVLTSIVQTVEKLDKELGKNLSIAIDTSAKKILSGLFEAWRDRRQKHWSPVMNVVGSLPKDGLAEIAEALVNLTKFRRRVTDVPETVGGPIDVAVITKGDGFVWVRRKHYFDPTLNPRFIAKYYSA